MANLFESTQFNIHRVIMLTRALLCIMYSCNQTFFHFNLGNTGLANNKFNETFWIKKHYLRYVS